MLKHVVLMPNTTKQIPQELLRDLLLMLRRSGCEVRACEESRNLLLPYDENIVFSDDEHIFKGAELILVLGGDGSIIEAARRSIQWAIPIAGINLGRLGYLADIEVTEIDLLQGILDGKGRIEERFMLDASIQRGSETIRVHIPALNDIVLSNGPIPKLLSFVLYCDGEMVENCYADGMILATPTGTTAYSLSAGGPVLDPRIECICATPICPQMTSNRPVIFSGSSELVLSGIVTRGNTAYLTVDGREHFTLMQGDTIRISRSEYRTRLMRIKKDGFLSALRRKLS